MPSRHLIRLGHRHIAMINASLDTQPARDGWKGTGWRWKKPGSRSTGPGLHLARSASRTGSTGKPGVSRWKSCFRRNAGRSRSPPSFVASDVQAHRRAGERRARLGVRDSRGHRHRRASTTSNSRNTPQLTTMRQPMYEMGVLAIERLFARMKHARAAPTLTTFLPELIVRGIVRRGTAVGRVTRARARRLELNRHRRQPANHAGVTESEPPATRRSHTA